MQLSNKIQIIYLNGPSSSGKTTLSLALQEALDLPFFHISLDKVISMMPKKINDFEGSRITSGYSFKKVKTGSEIIYQLQIGSFAGKIAPTFQEIVYTMAKMGHHLIIDDISFGKSSVETWKQKLHEFPVLWIGIKAPLHILEQREKNRGNRLIGSSKDQYEKIHSNIEYDLMLDTHENSIEELISKISRKI